MSGRKRARPYGPDAECAQCAQRVGQAAKESRSVTPDWQNRRQVRYVCMCACARRWYHRPPLPLVNLLALRMRYGVSQSIEHTSPRSTGMFAIR